MSKWRDTVWEEVLRYHEEKEALRFQLQDFIEFAEPTIRKKFPDNQNWEASIRRNLQELRDRNKIQFLGNGNYRIIQTRKDDEDKQENRHESRSEQSPHNSAEQSNPTYTDDEIIKDIKRVSNRESGRLSSTTYSKHGDPSVTTVINRFGSWKNALEEAGLEPQQQNSQYTSRISEEEILEEIRNVAKTVDWVPSASDFREHGDISISTVRNRFDSWTEARKKAGVNKMSTERLEELNESSADASREELIQEIRSLYEKVGETLTAADVVSFGEYDKNEYEMVFGSVFDAMREAGIAEKNSVE